MTVDFDAMSRLLNAIRSSYEVGDDKRVRALAYLLRLSVNDLINEPEERSTVYSSRAIGLQAGVVQSDRPDDTTSGRTDSKT